MKMLHSRIQLLRTYLTRLPPSYLTKPLPPDQPYDLNPASYYTEIDYPILRSIQALLNRIPLLIPADLDAFERESLAEKNDVALISLLGTLGQSIKGTKEVGYKHAVIDTARQSTKRNLGPADTSIDPSFLEKDSRFESESGMRIFQSPREFANA